VIWIPGIPRSRQELRYSAIAKNRHVQLLSVRADATIGCALLHFRLGDFVPLRALLKGRHSRSIDTRTELALVLRPTFVLLGMVARAEPTCRRSSSSNQDRVCAAEHVSDNHTRVRLIRPQLQSATSGFTTMRNSLSIGSTTTHHSAFYKVVTVMSVPARDADLGAARASFNRTCPTCR